MDQNASNEIMRRRHKSHLPLVYEGRNLFCMPRAGTSNPPEIKLAAVHGSRTPVQPCMTEAPRLNSAPPQHVPTPPGHYSNPLENMIAAAARLAALLVDGEFPTAVETRKARELLQIALVQQEGYSYSRDRIHSTPRPSQSYIRHMDSPAVSSNAKRHEQPCGHDPPRDGAHNLVDQDRVCQEVEHASQWAAH